MLLYYIILGVIIFECLLFNDKEKRGKYLFGITVFIIAIAAGMRSYSVGHDTLNYARIFINTSQYNLNEILSGIAYPDIEIGYMLVSWFFGQFSTNPSHFFLFVSLIQFFIVGFWIWKNSKEPFLSFLIFFCMFFTFYITGIRQSIAFSILLWSYVDVEKRKVIKFLLKVILASMFHSTAIIFVCVYFIYKIKNSNILYILAMSLFPIVYIFRSSLFTFGISIFQKYDNYEILTHGDAISYTVLMILIGFTAFFFKNTNLETGLIEQKNYSFYSNLVSVSILIIPFAGVNGAMLRIAMYFFMPVCHLIIYIYNRIEEFPIRVLIRIITISMVVFMFLRNMLSSDTYQYEFIGWENWFRQY